MMYMIQRDHGIGAAFRFSGAHRWMDTWSLAASLLRHVGGILDCIAVSI